MDIITPYELGKISVHKIIIYLRKSRAEGKETVEEVLARHERILQEFAIETFGTKIPEENIYREVVSGETLDERDAIKKVFSRLETEDIEALLVVEPQRISRGDMLDCGRVVQILKYTNTLVTTITKTYDLTNKFDREIFEAQLLQGNKFLEYHKEIMDRGKALSLREGKYVGSVAPFGYSKKPLDKGYMLVRNDPEAEIVETIFELFIDEGLSTKEVSNYLNKHQMKPKKSALWDYEMVRHVLKNEVYYGSLAWGKRPVVRKLINGELTKFRPANTDYMLVRGLQEAIISKERWDAAQDRLRNNRHPRQSTSRELKNPLAGMVYCKKCGYALVRVPNRRRNSDKQRKKVRKYEIDKVAINRLIREAREVKNLSYKEIQDFLGVKRNQVHNWFTPNEDKIWMGDMFGKKWFELKFLLDIESTEHDKAITTYIDPKPLSDTFMCSNQNCDMISCVLQKLEKDILDRLRSELKGFKHYVDNYEAEIIKDRKDSAKAIAKISNKLDNLRIELKNLRRSYNREEFTYDEYMEDKNDIESEIADLTTQLKEFEDSEENDKLIRCKKAIPKIEECLKEYNKMTVLQKNESLKSIIDRVTYSKTKRLNWRIKSDDDMTIHIDLKI